jgi:hypothetical protein
LTEKSGPFQRIFFFQGLGVSKLTLLLAFLEFLVFWSIIGLVDSIVLSVLLLIGHVVGEPGRRFSAA